MVALPKEKPSTAHFPTTQATTTLYQLPPYHPTSQPSAPTRPRGSSIKSELVYQIYMMNLGFWAFAVFALAWGMVMGNLGTIAAIPLIGLVSIMGVHVFGRSLGLDAWLCNVASLALGWFVPLTMVALYEFQTHLTF